MQEYETELDAVMIRHIDNEVKTYGVEYTINDYLRFMDCTHEPKIIQTIDYTYRSNFSCVLYVINVYADDKEKDAYMNKLLAVHQRNLDYEIENPPTVYDKTKPVVKRKSSKKLVQTEINFGEEVKPKKQSALERKIAAKQIKLSKLSFKLSPQ